MPNWNSEHLPQHDRFPYWREVLCQTYTSLQPISETSEPFRGEVSSARLNDLNVTSIASGRQKIYRRRNEIRKDSDAVYFLNLQLKGKSRMVQFGREALLLPGDFSLVDSTEPYLVDYCSDDWAQHSFRIPASSLGMVVPEANRRMAVRYGSESPLNSVAGSFLSAIARMPENLSPSEVALSNQVVSLVGLAIAPPDAPALEQGGTLRKCLARSIMEFISVNLHHSELSPALAAKHFRISVRYVHKAMEGSGTTFGKVMLEKRLERCAANLLSDKAAPISVIALRWGFNDLSHFSRSFRAKFEVSAKEYRCNSSGK